MNNPAKRPPAPPPTREQQKVQVLAAFENKMANWFKENGKRLRSLAGSDEEARRLFVAALGSISKNPQLMECTFESIALCLMRSAEYRLMPGALQECAYVPFKNHGVMEAVFVVQYQGLIGLLSDSGYVKDIQCEIRYEHDHWIHKQGSELYLEFEPAAGDRGFPIGTFCVIRTVNGGIYIKYMSTQEIERYQVRAPGAKSEKSPWNSQYDDDIFWMWKKTCLKQCAKLLPKRAIARKGEGAVSVIDNESESFSAMINATIQDSQKRGSVPSIEGARAQLDAPSQSVSTETNQPKGETVSAGRETNAPKVETHPDISGPVTP